MEIINTEFKDLYIIKPKVFEDYRGFFFESYNKKIFEEKGLFYNFVQDNQSLSKKNVFRGFHYQLEPYSQTKLVRVLKGKVIDYAIDLRKGSPTFGKCFSIELSEENKLQVLIPRGFAHGFLVLSETAEFFYKCDNYYNKESERGIRFDDPEININLSINKEDIIISDKDKNLPYLKNAELNFIYGETK
ncbi:MAG: dTDP-4-dehydrorhamnose 3,5-epimerase [Brevinematales bacterium]|nr:dTDP-4-dehydrorhamnose 3,5-epimerase [Brevinematales bacterium]